MNLYYEQHAGLSRRNTLFLHGNLASHRWWHPSLESLKSQGASGPGTIVLSDWRGCGKNEPVNSAFSLEDLAKDQLALIDRLGMKNDVAIVGHSLGGLIALQMMILEPQRFAKALLLDPVGAKGVIFDDSMYEAFRQMSLSAELTRTVILSTVLNGDSLDETFKQAIAADAFKAVKGIGTSVLEILKSVDLTQAAAQVRVPTLILHGALDQVIAKKDSEDLHRLMPNSKLEVLPEAGHCWNVENPMAFAKTLNRWLEHS